MAWPAPTPPHRINGIGILMLRVAIEGRVATLTLSRPPVNAMSTAWIELFSSVLDRIEQSDACVLVVKSDQRVFSAGADIGEIQSYAKRHGNQVIALARNLQGLFTRWEQLPQVTIAEVAGAALGGGLELVLACDLRIAADTCRMGLPELQLGLLPGAGGTQRLTALCGRAVAARLILGAEVISGKEIAELGLAQWVVSLSELEPRTAALAGNIATLSSQALTEAKRAIAAWFDPSRDGFAEELAATERLLASPDTQARLAAFFDKHAIAKAKSLP